MIFRCTDLETNGVDVKTCEVAQVAIVSTRSEPKQPPNGMFVNAPNMRAAKSSKTLCRVSSMPKGATKVHGLTVEQLKDEPPFGAKVRGLLGALTKPGVVVVTFNGARFDLPVIARYAASHGKLSALIEDVPQWEPPRPDPSAVRREQVDRFDELLNLRHVDVARVWQVARARKSVAPWEEDNFEHRLHADMFAGSLAAAHGFWCGRGFDGAHDATVDCVATLAVLRAMLTSGFVDVETAIRWSREPLPGDVDFDGIFKWDGDQAVCKLKKFQDVPIENVERGFLNWMLEPARDFHRNTKHVVREWLAGRYPIREYEKEDTT